MRARNAGYCESCGARARVLRRHHFPGGGVRPIRLCPRCHAGYAALAATGRDDDRQGHASGEERAVDGEGKPRGPGLGC